MFPRKQLEETYKRRRLAKSQEASVLTTKLCMSRVSEYKSFMFCFGLEITRHVYVPFFNPIKNKKNFDFYCFWKVFSAKYL